MKFRDTEEGIRLRKEVLEQLALNEGSEFIASINAGLNRTISGDILESARQSLSSLLIAEPGNCKVTPAVWGNMEYSDTSLKQWRTHSGKLLEQVCLKNNIKNYDLCPCGSGDKLKFCCKEALKE